MPPLPVLPPPTSAPIPASALVYVVDDDESIRRSLARLFRSARLPVETLPSAKAYLARAPHTGPSCLVLDVRMPGLDGLELQAALAGREDQIVFISGHGNVPICAGAMRAGAVDFLTKPVDDEDLLAAVRRALVRSAEVRQIAVVRTSAQARVELQQVLVNLVVNAMHAMEGTPDGSRFLEIETRSEAGSVLVSIRDRGHGIPPERATKIFDPFFSTKTNGLGIGLSICRRIIEDHHGRIEARNHDDGGAVFSFRLPVRAGTGG